MLRSLLSQNDSHAHDEVGAFPLVETLWNALGLRTTATQRGEQMRAVLWWLIEHHHEQALRQAGPCQLEACARATDGDGWHVLWLEHLWDSQKGFSGRFTRKRQVWLDTRAAHADQETTGANTDPPGQQRQRVADLDSILARGGLDSLDEYPIRVERKIRWHAGKSHDAMTALLAHLRSDDALLRQALAHLTTDDPSLRDALTRSGLIPPSHAGTVDLPHTDDTPSITSTAPDEPTAAALAPSAPPPAYTAPTPRAAPARPDPPSLDARERVDTAAGMGVPTSQPAQPRLRSAGTWRRRTLPRRQHSRGRRQPTPLHRRGPLRHARRPLVLAAAALLVVVCLLGGALFTPMRMPAQVPLAAARVADFIVAQQWSHDEPRVLAVIDPRTGAQHTLWPVGHYVHGAWVPPPAPNDYIWLTSPTYAPVTHLLAFSARNPDGSANLWALPITFGADGWPTAAPGGPSELAANCHPCDTLAWAPSGQWLLYNGSTGLMALQLTPHIDRQAVTTMPGDQWPACSTDGRWLAFQRESGDIVALPAWDCLPRTIADPWAQARYLEGYAPAWRPAWSSDGRWLAFTSALGGPWSVYVIAFDALTRAPEVGERVAAYLESAGGCTDPVWAQQDPPGGDVLVYGCDTPTPDNHHGRLVFMPRAIQPAWEAILSSGIADRDSLSCISVPVAAPLAQMWRRAPHRQSALTTM